MDLTNEANYRRQMQEIHDYQSNCVLAVEYMLSPDQRQAFLDRFCAKNPHYVGANVSDVLHDLLNADAHLEITEPMHEDHSDEIREGQVYLYSACAIAWLYVLGRPAMWPTVRESVKWAEEEMQRQRWLDPWKAYERAKWINNEEGEDGEQ